MVVVEVAVGVAVVGWFVSPNISKLSEAARSYAASKYQWRTGFPEKLQRLAEDLEAIRDTLDASRMCFVIHDRSKATRLWTLKDAIHDAEEIIDAFEYEILKKQQPFELASHVFGTSDSLNDLKKLVEKLDELRRSSQDLFQASSHQNNSTSVGLIRPIQRPTTTPLSPKDVLFGYHKEYAKLLSKLVIFTEEEKQSKGRCGGSAGAGDDGDSRVVAIIGHGGMGKTELARRAFKDQQEQQRVKGQQQSFDVFIWACTYAKFTKTEILQEIWSSAAGSKPAGQMNDTSMEAELIKLVDSKRCLLVLDDVCNDELASSNTQRKQTWEGVLAPFKKHGSQGSRIIITTRAEICASTLDAGARIVLDHGIDDEAMMLLLKKTAFGDATHHLHPQLQRVVEKKVVRRLCGSPLAAHTLVNDNGLKNIHSATRWDKDDLNNDNVVYTHLSSYQDLPPQLQRCFAFCSIFPNSHRFQRKELIRMWIAHGFVVDDQDGKRSMEDVARGYFHDLVSRSLFQEAMSDSSCCCYYVIHEQIHSMIRQVSSPYCISITSLHCCTAARLMERIPATARHLSVAGGCLNQLAKVFEFSADSATSRLKNLRTLLILKDDGDESPSLSAIDNQTLRKFKGVRVLDFAGTSITQLPESIGELKHLRYLHLPCTMTNLCDQVTKLLFLQTLGVSKKGNNKLNKFPDDMSSLINIRHLDIGTGCIAKMRGIGRMHKLQGSVEFEVGHHHHHSHSMSELAGMNCLRKTLIIKGLDTVTDKKEAEKAQLIRKESIKTLKLEWQHHNNPTRHVGAATDESSVVDADVLEGLQPHKNLRQLHITRYRGRTLPTWLGSGTSSSTVLLESLTHLYLHNCRKLKELPHGGQLPRLKILGVKELPCVERIGFGSGFPSLQQITLVDMQKLVAWEWEDRKEHTAGGGSSCMQLLFPKQLREVRISDCPLLRSLSALGCCRTSLRSLRVENCPAITEKSLPTNFTMKGFPSLDAGLLHIVGCSLQLQELP